MPLVADKSSDLVGWIAFENVSITFSKCSPVSGRVVLVQVTFGFPMISKGACSAIELNQGGFRETLYNCTCKSKFFP